MTTVRVTTEATKVAATPAPVIKVVADTARGTVRVAASASLTTVGSIGTRVSTVSVPLPATRVTVTTSPAVSVRLPVTRTLSVVEAPAAQGPAGTPGLDGIDGADGAQGPQGEPGPAGEAGASYSYHFSWGDASPVLAVALPANAYVVTSSVVIDTTFNGAAPTIELGTLADPDLIMPADHIDPRVANHYQSSPGLRVSDGLVYISINPGVGASQGAGTVYLEAVS